MKCNQLSIIKYLVRSVVIDVVIVTVLACHFLLQAIHL